MLFSLHSVKMPTIEILNFSHIYMQKTELQYFDKIY